MVNKILKYVLKIILYPSKRERDKRFLRNYNVIVSELNRMSEYQLKAEYIKVKSEYEYKKNISIVFLITLILSTIAAMWSMFSGFISNIVNVIAISNNIDMQQEIVRVGFLIAIILITVLTITLVLMIVFQIREIHKKYQYLLIIEGELK